MSGHEPWAGGDKRGNFGFKLVYHRYFGRYGVMLKRRYCGDQYGWVGSDGWDWTLTFVVNPRASTSFVDRASKAFKSYFGGV